MKPHIVRVVLNADREGDRRILDYLRYAGKPMSKLFKLAMREFIERQDRADEENLNLTNIRRVIHEELKDLKLSGGSNSFSQPMAAFEDDDLVSPLDFLDELAKMANFEEENDQ